MSDSGQETVDLDALAAKAKALAGPVEVLRCAPTGPLFKVTCQQMFLVHVICLRLLGRVMIPLCLIAHTDHNCCNHHL